MGTALLLVALASALAAGATSLAGSTRAGRRLLVAGFATAGAAVVLLGWALVTGDFSLAYVADQSSRVAAWPYRLAGLWGGMEGSLVLWVWLLSGHAVAAARLTARRQPALSAHTQAVLAAVAAAFLLPLVTVARPFDRLAIPALDGGGLAPVLENPAMLYHPLLLYLGYVGLVVPFALTAAALAAGRLDAGWLELCRRSTLVAWVLLTVGMAAGAHWAYVELGWGGYWAWDPVENAALMPWLGATAFLHSALLQERRGRAGTAAAGLVVATFVTSVLGAFLTRSGTTVSVHAFAEARAVGRILLVALVATMAGAVALLAHQRAAPVPPPARAPMRGQERALLGASVTLAALGGVVLFGTLVPLLSGLVLAAPMVAAPRFFSVFGAPLAAALAVLLVVGPGLGRTGRVSRGRPPRGRAGRRARGAMVAHVGAGLVLVGVAGSAFGSATTAVLAPGETAEVGGYTLRLERLTEADGPRRRELGAVVSVERGDQQVGRLHPELHAYEGRRQPQSESAVRSTPLADLLVTPRRIDVTADLVVLDAFVKPLVLWLWAGAALLALGGALALASPGRCRAAVPSPRRRPPALAVEQAIEGLGRSPLR